MPIPLLLIGTAFVAVGGTAVAWIYKEKTEAERRRQEELRKEISRIKRAIAAVKREHGKRIKKLKKEELREVRDKLITEARRLRKEREEITVELENLKKNVEIIINKPDTSPYLRNGLKRESVLIEDALSRAYAYQRYISWYESLVDSLYNREMFDELMEIDIPNSLLPDDWLYVGKLLLLDNKDEIKSENNYGQRILLAGVYDEKKKTYINEPEEKAFERYENDIPILIIGEIRKGIESEKIENFQSNRASLFRGSVLKGELYVHHLLNGIPFEVKPRDERTDRDVNFYFYKEYVKCKMRRRDKKYPLKRYHDEDGILVNAIEHDLLLKKIWISERPHLYESVIATPVYITYSNSDYTSKLENAIVNSQYKLSATGLDTESNRVTLRAHTLTMNCLIKEDHLHIEDIKEEATSKEVSIELPLQFEIIPEEVFHQNRSYFLDIKDSLIQCLNFISSEINYMKHLAESQVDDYEFFNKWLTLLEHQIEKEEIKYTSVQYAEMKREDQKRTNLLHVKITSTLLNSEKLISINSQINQSMRGKTHHGKEIKIAFRIRTSENEKYYLSPVGYLHDDIDIENKTITVALDGNLPSNIDFDPQNEIFIGFYTSQSALYRQKRALLSFQRGELTNPALKRMLISPSIVTKTVDPNEEKNFDRLIKWQNTALTENQREVVKRALLEKALFLIQGPPGTGKTTVIKEIVYQYLKDNPKGRCLIVSQQNTAVDNALERIYRENKEDWFLSGKKSIVRVAVDTGKVSEEIQNFTIDRWFDNYKERVSKNLLTLSRDKNNLAELCERWYQLINKESISDIDREVADVLLSSHQLVGATCVGFANKRLGIDRTEFDLVIIDEAARSTPPELLIPILRAKKVILIGDHYQLPPSVSDYLRDDVEFLDSLTLEFLEKSFFERIFEQIPAEHKAMLTEQFRMPPEVGNLISELFYHGQLKNGIIKSKDNFVSPETIKWIDVVGVNRKDGTSRYNIEEISAIHNLLLDIAKKIPKGKKKEVAVITPYTAQKENLRKMIKKVEEQIGTHKLQIKCGTVDSFQGQEADIVIYSCVRTDGNLSFLIDKRRLNVALSRVRENLFIVGHKKFLYRAKVD